MRVANLMSEAQLDAFEEFVDRGDDAGALAWLEANFPDYKTMVQEDFEIVRARLANAAGWISAVCGPSSA